MSTQADTKQALSTLNGTIYVDLGGHTVDMSTGSRSAFIRLEPNTAGYSTHVVVSNGTILSGDDPIVRFATVAAKGKLTFCPALG